jgi:uncharacterized membrane protein (UPF0136 family)
VIKIPLEIKYLKEHYITLEVCSQWIVTMKKISYLVLVYALIVLAGGIIGKIKADSTPSLVSGLISSIFLAFSAFLLFKEKKAGRWVALLLVFILDGFFTYRFLTTHAIMPAGLMSMLSLGMLFALTFDRKKELSKKSL